LLPAGGPSLEALRSRAPASYPAADAGTHLVVPILPHASLLERLLAIVVAEMRTVVGEGPLQPSSAKSAMALLECIGELAARHW
jgi:hypothetical protein